MCVCVRVCYITVYTPFKHVYFFYSYAIHTLSIPLSPLKNTSLMLFIEHVDFMV